MDLFRIVICDDDVLRGMARFLMRSFEQNGVQETQTINSFDLIHFG